MRHRLQFTPEKIASRLRLIAPMVYRRREALAPFRYMPLASPTVPPPTDPHIDDRGWETIQPGSYWGKWSQDFCLRSEFRVPDYWDHGRPLALHLPLGEAGDIFTHPEALLYIDGHPQASSDRYHHDVDLPPRVRDGRTHRIALHGWTGLSGWPPDPDAGTRLYMRQSLLVEIDRDLEALVTLARTALDVASRLSEHEVEKHRILNALNDAFLALDTRAPLGASLYASVPEALGTLRSKLATAGPAMDVDMIAVGHAHMDIAYLWTVDQSRRKNGRTYSNVLGLMEAFPDYHFSHSQPQLYEFTRQDYPEVFEGIRHRVSEGRWEPMGGMWVEPDVNLAGSEALVRQITLGRRWFEEHLGPGAETPLLWLPDTFGFPWCLPQLMRLSGLKWFATNKMSWNQYTKLPGQIFRWRGLDGSEVLGHLLCTPRPVQYLPHPTTYKSRLTAGEVLGTWEYFDQKDQHATLPICFGYGDGGGGPTRELIVQAQAYRNMPGAPRVRMGRLKEFFLQLDAKHGKMDLPVWDDEIALELHRGVLTSQASIKRYNRRNEVLLHDAEFLAAWAAIQNGPDYPTDGFREAWEIICRNQFHDIITGTALTEVFEEAEREYGRVNDIATGAMLGAVNTLTAAAPAGATWLALNPAPMGGTRIARVQRHEVGSLQCMATGKLVPVQQTRWGTLIEVPEVPAYGHAALGPADAPAEAPGIGARLEGDLPVIETPFFRVEFDAQGEIARLHDREADREVLKPGHTGNRFQVFEDRPLVWDAWDIESYFEDRREDITNLVSMRLVETGPIRATVRIEREWRRSRIVQRISFWRTTRRIDFETEIDWRERHTLLKVAFPVAIHAPRAAYDTQWGVIERPTHRNLPSDFARFEVCAHRWADLSEGDYGVALLNDCKYGHDIRGDVMRLSLIKSATMPNPKADQGSHIFTYALMPHRGDWRGAVQREGYHLNDPLILMRVPQDREAPEEAPAMSSIAAVMPSSVVLETVKMAEDGDGLILRLYESRRTRGRATVHFDRPMASVDVVDLLERPLKRLKPTGRQVSFDVTPFQIVTLRCRPD
jgi:alpha-mannosidase